MRKIKVFFQNLFRWETLLFFLVFFSNFAIGSFLLTDILYLLFAAYLMIKYPPRNDKIMWAVGIFILIGLCNILRFPFSRGSMSMLRFIYNLTIFVIIYLCINKRNLRSKAIEGYIFACCIFSIVVVVQFALFYGIGINLKIDFGEFGREVNAASGYSVLDAVLYRTGGLFKEPSWYAAFCAPVCFLLTMLDKKKELVLCLLGLVLSTSSLAFMVLAIYIVWVVLRYNTKLGILATFVMAGVYYFFPIIFSRLIGSESAGSKSFDVRIAGASDFITSNNVISVIGIDPSILYNHDGTPVFFCNTMSFIYLFFGVLGLALFLKLIYFRSNIFLTISIASIMIAEGLYGRIDFWMMLLACKLFNDYFVDINSKAKLKMQKYVKR